MSSSYNKTIYSEPSSFLAWSDLIANCGNCEFRHSRFTHFISKDLLEVDSKVEGVFVENVGDKIGPEPPLKDLLIIKGAEDISCRINQNIKHNGECKYFVLGVGTKETAIVYER